jgi:hypothetical protein
MNVEECLLDDGSVAFRLEEIRIMQFSLRANLSRLRRGREKFWEKYKSGSQEAQRFLAKLSHTENALKKLDLLEESMMKPLEKYQKMTYQFPGCPRQ